MLLNRGNMCRDALADLGTATDTREAASEWAARMSRRHPTLAVKRVLDILGALLIGTLLAPVWLAASVALKLSGYPAVLFRQERVGLNGQPFVIFKFQTVRRSSQADPAGLAAAKALFLAELTGSAQPDPATGLFKTNAGETCAIGRFLRRYSIDEIPQLLNVLRGDMSLVGPRPALTWEVELFTAEQRLRHLVRPGMTGLWQVSGRSALAVAEMLNLDLIYVRNLSIARDLFILLKTPYAVLFGRSTG